MDKDSDVITRREHEEYSKRVQDEDQRQNKRLDLLEKSVSQIGDLVVSIKELATNMRHMAEEQEKQGDRLQALEGKDGEMWRQVMGYVITFIIGILISFAFSHI